MLFPYWFEYRNDARFALIPLLGSVHGGRVRQSGLGMLHQFFTTPLPLCYHINFPPMKEPATVQAVTGSIGPQTNANSRWTSESIVVATGFDYSRTIGDSSTVDWEGNPTMPNEIRKI